MMKNINIKTYYLPILVLLSFTTRILTTYFFEGMNVDKNFGSANVNEWYVLLDNLVKYKSYAFYSFNGNLIPSVYMPPMYPFLLYLIKILTSFEGKSLLQAIFFFQIILSTYSIYLFYQLNLNFFTNKLSLVNSTIFSFIPLNIYACGQVSSINLQILFSLLFLNFLLAFLKKKTAKNIIGFSIITGLLILTRGEFILIFIITIVFGVLYKKIDIKSLTKVFLIILIVLSPYLVRNYIQFNKIILVKSLGYNLWKGNNEMASVQGYENYKNDSFVNLKNEINNLEKNSLYEINRDKIFLNHATKNLINDPILYSQLFFKKLFSFYFIDFNSSYPNYYKFLHYFPIILIAILSFPGLFIFFSKINNNSHYILLYLLLNLLVFSIFFILPRYKLIILPIQIMIASHFINYFYMKIINGNKKKNNFKKV